MDINGVIFHFHYRVLRPRIDASCVSDGVKPRNAGGQRDVRARRLNGNFPVVAGHVPIQFIVIFKKSQRIQHAIVENDGVRRIIRVGNVNLKLRIAAFAVLLPFQRTPIAIGGADVVDQKRVIQALRICVLDRNRAVEAMPIFAGKTRLNRFGHVDGSVFADHHLIIEVLNNNLANCGERRQRNEECGQAKREKAYVFHFRGSRNAA